MAENIGLRIFQACIRPIQRLPIGFHYFWGKVFAWVLRNIMHYRQDVVMANVARAFPEKKYKELTAIANDFYSHLGKLFAETMYFGGFYHRPEALHNAHFCEIENPDAIMDPFSEGKSMMVLSSHYGNWEITGGAPQFIYDEKHYGKLTAEHIAVVYKKMKSEFWDKFMGDNRCAPYTNSQGYLESHSILRYAVSHRKEQIVYVFPTDQHPYKGATYCEVPSFMGQPTKTMTGGAALACKFGIPVFYMAIHRESDGHYKMRFRRICEDASTMSPDEVMVRYYALLEEDVRKCPDQYLWSHKRWK